MTSLKRLIACALMLSVPLAASGCATFGLTPTTTQSQPRQVVDLSRAKLRPFKTRDGDTCETQREAAEQNSVRDSKPGAPVVYCARCDCPHLYDGASGARSAPAPDALKPDPSTS
jgi:hypothetical protein